jgi:hypothetical protein
LNRKKRYGNLTGEAYEKWLRDRSTDAECPRADRLDRH